MKITFNLKFKRIRCQNNLTSCEYFLSWNLRDIPEKTVKIHIAHTTGRDTHAITHTQYVYIKKSLLVDPPEKL